MKGLLGIIILCSLVYFQGLAAGDSALLRYDDGVPEDGMWIDSNRGHAVLFTTPISNWTLSKIAISGRLNPESSQDLIVLEIWDENFDVLYSRADNPKSYFGDELAWAEIDIPDITLYGDFFVCLFEFSNVYVGADLSNTSSGRSCIVSRNPNRIVSWDLLYPSNETDWSIVAVGVSATPTVDLVLKSEQEAVVVEAMITDPDGDLARASMQIIDAERLDVLWSEQRLIDGVRANLTFSWPFVIFQITDSTNTIEPIFAFNTVGVSPDRDPYMTYLAPCTLRIEPDGIPTDAAAYFGEDGEFHALLGTDGLTYYMSRELLGAVQPQKSYGDYVKNNVTLKEVSSALSFFKLNLDEGMEAYPTILLTRSPIHHYKLRLDKISVSLTKYIVELDVEDTGGNKRKVKERISV
jgi:hypothetical protein